jgi:DNA-binding response OmpR family regulator
MTRRILLIDDSPLQLRVREAVLRDAGLEVCIATSAESGLALLRAPGIGNSIGAVVTDHIMPGVSGPEFVRRLRSTDRHMPVIVVTGLPDAELEYDGLEVIVRHKPCQPTDLIALVRDCIRDQAA